MNPRETLLSQADAQQLREEHYNATITWMEKPNDRLMRVRVRLDEGAAENGPALHYQPGQYTTLGLGYWERRLELVQPETLDEKLVRRVVKRAYSISCRMLDDQGVVTPAGEEPEPEFYIALVTEADKPPAFTPRLFGLSVGDRLQMGVRPKGVFTLGDFAPTTNLLFASTGTGEAPHNAMISSLLAGGHRGKIANLCCVRYESDLGYLAIHRQLEAAYPNYRYLPLTTREPINRNQQQPGYVGVRYVQDLLSDPDAADELGFALSADHTLVYLCGNPAMIGVPNRAGDAAGRYPTPRGVVEVLEGQGFRAHDAKSPGNIYFEKYW
ncbi:ferredoxin--NADP reductase [Botrimarina hoheduenensis]|uniref:ferredoxin--NADP(+) reductase n=1 Tax=Botrimarina hoheduenensis TaxID=2528000 RepID=A0A5C5VZP6_9BACT|nr:ferredoxin--NADP reductase [Botrimarina hoheduenensis]TWT43279.1 Ferredoxin--NADP reductase [Botrimarina hoheduenensis]